MNSKIREATKNLIVGEALELFLTNPISLVTIQDVAEKSEIGEATIYRYFGKKQNLVCDAAIMLWDRIYKEYFPKTAGRTGYETIANMYNAFYSIFSDAKEYFSFINQFDAFILSENPKDKIIYEDGMDIFKVAWDRAYEMGVEDGTLKMLDNKDLFYYSTTHALLNLCKKLSSETALTKQDEEFEAKEEIKVLIEVILYRIKK